ncbi:MAG: hypothetical protein AAF682_30460, partial [Planctomycetota bacterium]
PQRPELRLQPRETLNVAATFEGTDGALALKGERVAVVSGWSSGSGLSLPGLTGFVPFVEGVPNFVEDVFLAALQREGIAVVDRDYLIYLDRERAIEAEGSLADQFANQSGPTEADYLVVIHAVPIPASVGGLREQDATIPLQVDEATWSAYEVDREAYRAAVERYNKAVDTYEQACLARLQDLRGLGGKAIEVTEEDLPQELLELVELRRIKSSVEGVVADFLGTEEPLDWDEGEWYQRVAQGEISPDTLPNGVGSPDEDEGPPSAITAAEVERSIYRDPSEVIPKGRPVPQTKVYDFSISVRVISYNRTEADWFGFATARNVSLTATVNATCSAIVDRMVATP